MYLQKIRNATSFLYYGGKTFLIDPMSRTIVTLSLSYSPKF